MPQAPDRHIVPSGIRGRAPAVRGVVVAVIGIVLLVVVITLISGLATTFRKTPADQIALSYGGGPFEGNQFQKIVEPGSGLVFNGVYDKWYEYPVTQRNYIISRRDDEGDVAGNDVVVASTSDKVEADWEIAVYFKLNTSIIRQFHETIGLKYQAWSSSGWARMLNDNFRNPIESALQVASRRFTAADLYSSTDAINAVQREIAADLKDRVASVLGAPYFCGPTYTRGTNCPDFQVIVKKPTLPADVVQAFQDQVSSEAAIVTAQNEAQAKVEKAKGDQAAQAALQGIYSDPSYVAYIRALAMQACASNSNCTLVVTEGETGVNVNTG